MAGDFGEKNGILARCYLPIAFALYPIAGTHSHGGCKVRPGNQDIEVFEDRVLFVRAHRNFKTDIVRQLGEGTDVRHDDGLAQTQRPRQAAGGFAHRGIAQIEDDVACAHVIDKLVDGCKANHADVLAQAQSPYELRYRQLRMRFPHQNHANPRIKADQAAQGAQGFSNPLVGLEVPEGADERRGFVDTQFVARSQAVGFRNPGTVRDYRNGAGKALLPHLAGHELTVNHQPASRLQQAPRHGQAVVVRADFLPADTLGKGPGGVTAVEFALVEIGLPIPPLNRQIGYQVMQVGLVHHHHAGVTQCRFIAEIVPRIIAYVINRNVGGSGVERVRPGRVYAHRRIVL